MSHNPTASVKMADLVTLPYLQQLLAGAGLSSEDCYIEKAEYRPGNRLLLQLRGAAGERFKVRSFATTDSAAQMIDLRALIGEHPGFTRVLSWSGTLVLEEWVEGASLAGIDHARTHLQNAGALLAGLHQIFIPDRHVMTTVDSPLLKRSLEKLQILEQSGALAKAEGIRLAEALLANGPECIHQGLVHGDFCGENLLWTEHRGVVSIDNERLRLGPVAYDLGRVMARWLLPSALMAQFLSGYKAAGGPAETDSLPFWELVGMITSAWFWVRNHPSAAEGPLQRLQAWGLRPEDEGCQ